MNQQRKLIFLSFGSLLICGAAFAVFLRFHEARVDRLMWYFDDPVFPYLPAMDVSLYIFSITYGTLIAYAVINRKEPYFLSQMAFSYALLLIFRAFTLSILPLKEPESIIFLNDPFLNFFIYQGTIDGDLFFSGHTATMCLLLFWTVKHKWVFALFGVVLGTLLMVQRVHYSIDILGAIPFAYISVKIVDFAIYRRLREG
jgi:hypothetical protein